MADMKSLAGDGKGHSAPAETLVEKEKFSLCLNVAGVDPQKVKVSLAGRRLEITGQHIRMFRQGELGITRYNYCGFSNELRLPPNLDLNSLAATITDDVMLTIEADYYHVGVLLEVQDRDDESFQPISLPISYKYTTPSIHSAKEVKIKQPPFWTPCLLPIPGTRCENQSSLLNTCHHSLPGSLCNLSPSDVNFPTPDDE